MGHPLTSKERRGLVAVAAAALLCIGAGFVFRNCGSRNAPASVIVIDNDSAKSEKSEKSEKSDMSDKSGKKGKGKKKGEGKGTKKKAPEKVYPTREPLDEPIYSND